MKKYENRGKYILFLIFLYAANGVILMFFEKTRSYGIGGFLMAVLFLIPYYTWRKLTPEQYEEVKKHDGLPTEDERDTARFGRVSRVVLRVMLISLVVSAEISFLVFENKLLALFIAAQLGVMLIAWIVTSIIINKKM